MFESDVLSVWLLYGLAFGLDIRFRASRAVGNPFHNDPVPGQDMKMAGSNADGPNGGHRSPEGWNRLQAMVEGFAAPASDRMLELCGIEQGLAVLDVAAGTGVPSLRIAGRVGKEGSVLATDLSGEMLDMLKKKADAAGLENVETRIMDGQNLDVPPASVDAIVCQFGLMLFPDPDRSLRSMFKALRHGGRAGVIVFTTPDRNPFMSIPANITRKRLNLPPPKPGGPGHFSLGDAGLLESKFKDAGFADVKIDVVTSELRTDSAAEFTEIMRAAGGGPTPMLAKEDDATKNSVWNEIAASLKEFDRDDGCVFPAELLVAVGTRP